VQSFVVMDDAFEVTADAFVEMAHRIVWASVATVDRLGRPRSRVLHPYWQRDGELGPGLVGVIATSPTPIKRTHLEAHPYISVNYWASDHDTCTAECTVEWLFDDESRIRVWELFEEAPAPVGYDPAIIPPWSGGPTSDAFAVLRLTPWRLRVMPGTLMTAGQGELLTWRAASPPG
jgi:hypothetical protein